MASSRAKPNSATPGVSICLFLFFLLQQLQGPLCILVFNLSSERQMQRWILAWFLRTCVEIFGFYINVSGTDYSRNVRTNPMWTRTLPSDVPRGHMKHEGGAYYRRS